MRLNDIGGNLSEGYRVVPGFDRDKYQKRQGLEGPFSTKSGKVVYYDKVEGKYYDPDTDMYIEYDDWRAMNEAGEDTFMSALKGLKTWQVVIMNNYYRGKYSDYSGRYYYVLASSPEEARQVVLDNADAILQDLLSMKSVNGKKILPRGSAIAITDKRIGEIKDGTEAGRMSTAGFKRMFGPQGPMMVKLSGGAVVDVQGQEQGVAEGKYTPASETEEDIFIKGKKVGKITKITTKNGMVFYRAEIGNSSTTGADTRAEAIRDLKRLISWKNEKGVAEGYDKWGWHTSVNNGEFMPTKYGNKAYVYLHDLDNEGSKGGPQLVTVNKPAVAKKLAQQFGGKVVKTDLNTYRIVKPAEQGVAEGTSNIGQQIKAAYQKIYDAGDDAVEFAFNDSPIFAQYWDEYEGDLDSIIAEVDPKELQVIYSELQTAVEDQGLAEGSFHNPGQEDSPVAQAITRRILMQRTDLLAKYGPEKVGQAIDEVADWVGDVDEIGSSDVSGWIRHVEQMLGNMGESQFESEGAPKSALGKALWRDLSKFKKASPAQQQRNKERWATNPHNPMNKAK